MSGEKWLHGCATFIHNDKIHVVVAGGYSENGVLNLTEIWNVNSDEGWIQGKKKRKTKCQVFFLNSMETLAYESLGYEKTPQSNIILFLKQFLSKVSYVPFI